MKGAKSAASSASLASPAVVVILVLMVGATIYLWRARYIRRKAAFVTIAALLVALALLMTWQYLNPMRDISGIGA